MPEPLSSTAAGGGGGRLRNAFGGVLCAFTLLLIGVIAFSIRLFSVRSTRTAQFRSYWEFDQGFARPYAVSPVR